MFNGVVGVAAVLLLSACLDGDGQRQRAAIASTTDQPQYRWERLTEHAAFPPSYNFPVHVDAHGRFVALHSEGTWVSRNALEWTRGALPFSGMNSAYLRYVQHDGATWAFGTLRGNYERFSIEPVIRRTSDYESWEKVGRAANLPGVVFYAAASFLGDLWILGGYDGSNETASVWRSSDGLEWHEVTERAPWSPREGASAIVFRDRLFLLGGGELDGRQFTDVWSTADGVEWRRETERMSTSSTGGTPVVFDDRLWLIGVNRNNGFSPGILVSDDGITWREETAPWSPRGAVAVWTDGVSLYMAGGKYSTVEGGETVFVYHNDVWRMHRASDS